MSLLAGIASFPLGFSLWGWAITYRPSGSVWGDFFKPDSYVHSLIPGANQHIGILGAFATVSAIMVIIGAILIYIPGKETVGGILVIVFSGIGLISLGFPIAIWNVIGIVGGAVGLAKR